jgi:hypothetical protein
MCLPTANFHHMHQEGPFDELAEQATAHKLSAPEATVWIWVAQPYGRFGVSPRLNIEVIWRKLIGALLSLKAFTQFQHICENEALASELGIAASSSG